MEVIYRLAQKAEAGAIADFYMIASEGLAEYVWDRVQDEFPGLSPRDIGAASYAREGVAYSYANTVVAIAADTVVGMAMSVAADDDPDLEPADDPVLRPYNEFKAPDSLYVPGLAVAEGFRGRGIGAELLARTETRARDMALPRLSLIVFERNAGACRFYRREGFRETDRRPIVPHPLLHIQDGDAILMVKEVG